MRETPAAFVLLVCACGAAVREPPLAVGRTPEAMAVPAAHSGDAPPDAAFDAIASRGATLAAGMREVARKESGGESVVVARADGRDLCVRVAYEANAPVVAKLLDASGAVLASGESAAREGVLGEHGPVCVRKGGVLSAVAGDDASAASPRRVHWVAWAAP